MLCWQCSTIWNHSNNPVCARIVSVPITLITSAYHGYHGMISGVCLDAIQTLVTAPIQITAIQAHATSSPSFHLSVPGSPPGLFHALFFGSVGSSCWPQKLANTRVSKQKNILAFTCRQFQHFGNFMYLSNCKLQTI